jgi:hypothetical protein
LQEGKYQMYKLNGRISVVESYFHNQYKVVWLVRDIQGYSTSVYRWVTNFYPKLMPNVFWYFKLLPWSVWSRIFFGVVSKDHINDCLYVYKRLREGKNDFLYLTTYSELVKNKEVRDEISLCPAIIARVKPRGAVSRRVDSTSI